MMKLYLVHAGYYNQNISGGLYEAHTNFFVAANDAADAKQKAKSLAEFQENDMHIDGIREIRRVGGYDILLSKSDGEPETEGVQYDYDASKKL